MIEFLLNNELVKIEYHCADLTVLEYLRNQRQLCGTKEGCASGDCGACTVVIAEQDKQELEYKNVNSCITFLGSLHGKQLLTVEHLKYCYDNKNSLHPTQKAMIDHHGSQCGFCTPGFVMSMFSLYKNANKNDDGIKQNIEEYLAGNLCRCTGYKPIINAAMEATSTTANDQFNLNEVNTNSTLQKLENSDTSGSENFHIPKSCKAASNLIKQYPNARLLGGGTDLALEVTQQLHTIDQIIYLGEISELKIIDSDKFTYKIGAAVSLNAFNKYMKDEFPELYRLLLRFGSRQIRNVGTIGGNIANASPIGDLPPVLIALDAQLILQSESAKREMPIEKYFIGYKKTALKKQEILHSILIPRKNPNHHLKIYKVSKRIDDDISAVCMACYISVESNLIQSIRIALGGMAAIPKRATACEKVLIGKPLNSEIIVSAQKALDLDFQPIDDVRASANYRMQVAKNLLTRLQIEMTDSKVTTNVTQ